MRWWALLLFAVAACNVEPRMIIDPEPPVDGGTVVRDAGMRDGGVDCRLGQVTCGPNEFCGADGLCASLTRGCRFSSECATGDVCVKPMAATSTVTPGSCAPRPNGCEVDAECEGRCLGVGVCGPAADRFVVVGAAPSPVLSCADALDCGPGSVCRGAECGRCQADDDCAGGLLCSAAGVCEEPESCLSSADCYDGNVCGMSATCERPTSECSADPENDFASGATALEDGWYGGLTVCGDDVDWFSVEIPHLYGAYVVITATASHTTLDVEIDPPTETTGLVRSLELPNVVAFAVPQVVLDDPLATTTLWFSVGTLDTNAEYAVEVIADRRGCADVLDLYGDRAEHALRAPPNVAFERVGCPNGVDRVAVDALADDQVIVSATWMSPSMDVDFFLRGSGGALVTTTPTVASNAMETVTSVVLTAADRLTVEANTRRAPTPGTPYTMSVSRDLGTREAICASPPDLVLSNGISSTTETFAGASNLGRPECPANDDCGGGALCALYSEYERRDRLYRITPPSAPAVLTASVRPLNRAAARMSLALLSSCEDDTADLVCNSSPLVRNATSIERRLTTADPVFLMVSSDGEIEDFSFTLDVAVEPVLMPLNDMCFDAVDLAVSGTQRVATYGAANDDQLRQGGICGSAADGAGPDRFYRMTLSARERAALELTGPQGGYLWAGTSCGAMTETCTTAATIASDFTSPIAITTFEPGIDQTFYVAVDGLRQGTEGAWTLRTIREPELQCLNDGDCTSPLRCDDYACRPVPAADACPGQAVTLVNGFASIAGSTGAANNRYAPRCGGSASPDVVYAVTLPAGLTDVAFRIADARFDPLLAVRFGRCDADPNEVCVDDVRYPDVLLPEVRIESPLAGTYYVIVDAYAGEGPFTLEIEAAP